MSDAERRVFPLPYDLDRLHAAGIDMSRGLPGVRVRYRGVLFDVGALREPAEDAWQVRVRPYCGSMYMLSYLSPQLLKDWTVFCEGVAWSTDLLLAECKRVAQQMAGELVIPEDAP